MLAPLLLALLLAAIPAPALCAETVPVAVVKEDYAAYLQFTRRYGDWPFGTEGDFENHLSRSTADLLIITRALKLGGLDCKLEFLVTPNTKRSTTEVGLGNAVIGAQQLPADAVSPEDHELYHVSDAVTRFGEFHKVFYTTEQQAEVLAATSTETLNAAGPGIIGIHWNSDKRVLNQMGITNLRTCATFESMIKMVIAGRARWIPLEASGSKGMSGIIQGVRFVPVPGIKFALLESRHFLVSRAHPKGERVFEALQKGLREMRRKGLIRNVLTHSGFFNTQIDSWKLLNEDAVKRGPR